MTDTKEAERLLLELDKLYEDSSYSAQTYFEAAKSAAFWGRSIVFLPAVAAALASLLVTLGMPKGWGAVGAISAAVAATASYLGSDRRANALKETARRFTALRHTVRLERSLASGTTSAAVESSVRSLMSEYSDIVATSELTPNRFFQRAQSRISSGVLRYDSDAPREEQSSGVA